MSTPEAQCLGRHTLEYAIRFDSDQLDDIELLRASQDYRCPFLIVPAGVAFEPPLELEGDVVYSCLKGAEDNNGLIVRVFNPSSQATTARITGPVAVDRVRLDETDGTPVPSRVVQVDPGEIATLRLRARSANRRRARALAEPELLEDAARGRRRSATAAASEDTATADGPTRQ